MPDCKLKSRQIVMMLGMLIGPMLAVYGEWLVNIKSFEALQEIVYKIHVII